MLAHVPSFGRNPRGSPDFLAYPVPKACMNVLGTWVPRRLGVARSASSPKAAQALGCSVTPVSGSRLAGSPAWHGLPQCPGCGHWVSYCCAAFVFGSGLRLGVGFVNPASPGWGLGWVCLGTVCGVVPLVSAVCGVRGWGSVLACLWDVCGFVRARLAPRRFRFQRAVWACVLGPGLGCAPPFLAGLSGCVFCAFFFLQAVPVPGLAVPVPPSPFFRAGLLALFFFRGVCLHVSVSLFPVGRCSWLGVAGFGWVVPLCLFGGHVFGAFGGGVWPPLVLLSGGLVAVGCFRAPPLPPLCVFFWVGGPACSFLCLPSAGARTGPHSVLSSGLLLAVAFCLAVFRPHGSGRLCTRWARRPFLPG